MVSCGRDEDREKTSSTVGLSDRTICEPTVAVIGQPMSAFRFDNVLPVSRQARNNTGHGRAGLHGDKTQSSHRTAAGRRAPQRLSRTDHCRLRSARERASGKHMRPMVDPDGNRHCVFVPTGHAWYHPNSAVTMGSGVSGNPQGLMAGILGFTPTGLGQSGAAFAGRHSLILLEEGPCRNRRSS